MTARPSRRSAAACPVTLLLVVLAVSVGCRSGDTAGPPTFPSGIDRAVITVHLMSGDARVKTITDADDIAALRTAVNRLPHVGKGARRCVSDRGTWSLTFTGKHPRTTMTFDESGCNEVHVRTAAGAIATRQGNEQLRTQLTELIS